MVVRESLPEKSCNRGAASIFGIWMLTVFKTHASYCPSWLTSGKAGRKAMCCLLWLCWEAQSIHSHLSPNPNHHKSQSQLPSPALLSHFQTYLGACLLPPESCHLWVTNLFVLSSCITNVAISVLTSEPNFGSSLPHQCNHKKQVIWAQT